MSRAGMFAPAGSVASGCSEVGKPGWFGATLKLKKPVGPPSSHAASMFDCSCE